MIGEKVYKSKKDINYIFKKNPSNKLIVVFSGYSNNPNIKAPYNYINTLKDNRMNQLYIADSYGYDGRGCWYLCENGDYSVERSIIELIENTMKKFKIKKSNVILIGTSKGGYASIYYGIKYGFKKVIAGAPQIFLCDYLKLNTKVLNSIASSKVEQEKINNIIYDMEVSNDIEIKIICGRNDHHLKKHILPFVDKNYHKKISLQMYHGGHNDLGVIFTKILNDEIKIFENKKLAIYDKGQNVLFDKSIKVEDLKEDIDKSIVKAWYDAKEKKIKTFMRILSVNVTYACYLECGDRLIHTKYYNKSPYFEFDIDKLELNKEYRVKWFVKDYTGCVERLLVVVNMGG